MLRGVSAPLRPTLLRSRPSTSPLHTRIVGAWQDLSPDLKIRVPSFCVAMAAAGLRWLRILTRRVADTSSAR